MKRIWLFCLCLASLSLVGCFHVPDEDWLPSKNSVDIWDIQKDDEMDQALNDIMEWINMVSSQRNDMKNEENEESEQIINEGSDENVIEINEDNIADNESTDWETGDIVDNPFVKYKKEAWASFYLSIKKIIYQT